ncbi:putative membrane protein [Leucobacter exalbidus]|uniref:Membrane protein n=1 Tax=Leucobacter exalbidus TaxID=662960 RepID=A0A940PY25_9MICO|nr:YhgE/Pip domain-containing protein [Leucobacter exalbidus]MBP1327186.1 putative membrane protein [Leucobacter exalbidus]
MKSKDRIFTALWPIVVCAAIALIPLIYAGLLVWSNVDPTHNLSSIPAAIVNVDEAAEAADGSTQHLGDDLVDELLSNEESTNFDWTVMDANDAAAQLEAGKQLVVLTIPADFSQAAVSAGSDEVADAAQAKLVIATNDGSNLIMGNIAATVGEKITDTLRTQVSETYLENVYLGFTDVHGSITDAADGASELAGGAVDAADGSGELVVGLQEIADGTVDLSDGAATLAAGTVTATEGASSLATGLQTLNEGAAAVPENTKALADGAVQTATGAGTLATGASEVATGASSLSEALGTLALGAGQVADGGETALAGAQTLNTGAGAALTGATTLDDGLDALIANYSVMTDDQRLATLNGLAAGSASLVGENGTGLTALAAGTTALVGDEETGLTKLAAGGRSVATGAQTVSDESTKLVTGADQVSDGAAQLSGGATQVSDGASALQTGLATLVEGIGSAHTGADQLAAGMPALSSGAAQLAEGTVTLKDGASSAVTGASTLDDGLGELSKGADELSTVLNDGVHDIPNYSDDEARQLSQVSAAPVVLEQERINEVPEYGYGLAPYFMGLSLWVGALAFYMMMPALKPKLMAGRGSSIGVALRSLAPGALMALVQSMLMVGVVHFAVGIELENLAGAFGIALLTSLTFFAINQALIALLGPAGRFVALVFMVFQLASAGGSYPIQTAPDLFQTLNSWLPLTYPVEAFRSMIAGGTIGVSTAVWVLSCWFIGAVVVAVGAVTLKRRGLSHAEPAGAEIPAGVLAAA